MIHWWWWCMKFAWCVCECECQTNWHANVSCYTVARDLSGEKNIGPLISIYIYVTCLERLTFLRCVCKDNMGETKPSREKKEGSQMFVRVSLPVLTLTSNLSWVCEKLTPWPNLWPLASLWVPYPVDLGGMQAWNIYQLSFRRSRGREMRRSTSVRHWNKWAGGQNPSCCCFWPSKKGKDSNRKFGDEISCKKLGEKFWPKNFKKWQ